MSLHFLKPGLQTSIQDSGRPGMLRWGLPRGGAADTFAMALANLLLGNPATHPCLEVALTGPVIEFSETLSIAICGAHFELTLNGTTVENDRVIPIKKGDQLSFGKLKHGCRAYLALSAEFGLPEVFHSQATHLLSAFGGLDGRAICAGDIVALRHCRRVQERALPDQFHLRYSNRPLVRILPGTEAHHFPQEALEVFNRGGYAVSSQSNRMGIRLDGTPLVTDGLPQMVSSALCPGTVQIPPNGLPIISFVEGQTIGGYPRIAHVISADLNLLGQLQARDRIDFEPVSLSAAHQILRDKSRLLETLSEQLARV
ncbi:biotin-dependent carboxyltransferase family protein [Microbulbifer aggregans]|uniref:5-oxoprolinase subunit C family protein n=1 Tax=Microbulbifer aggregans TaxID=1769779 RepID=UPI001CFE5CC1|nr:biotin-dependent carboxyltransferase family protein [Microbulbifer aggregans]